MNRPVIAIDVDDVLADTAREFIAYSNQQWGTQLTVDDYQDHWADMWQLSHEETERRAAVWRSSGIVRQYNHKEASAVVLQRLARDYRLIVTTARPDSMEQDTLAWLATYYPQTFETVHFAGFFGGVKAPDHKSYEATKADLYRSIEAEYVIDDQLKHCLAAAEAGMDAILFGNYSWNQTDALPAGVTRCNDWLAVQEYFDALGRD